MLIKVLHSWHRFYWQLIIFLLFSPTIAAAPPSIMQAKVYQSDVDISRYWVSEKLDGVRARWDGKNLVSRQGNIFHAPTWFTENFPSTPLDGELWMGRNTFQQLISIVKKQEDKELGSHKSQWRHVKFMVFDLPITNKSFTERIEKIKKFEKQTNSPYLIALKQTRLANHTELMALLNKTIDLKGEGLMLHHENALYIPGRSNQLLKVKKYEDAEAKVIGYEPGKGKFIGMMGSLKVRASDGMVFKIGSGFSNKQRRSPPPIGSTITYKYYGKTQAGIPKFASFLRIRTEDT